MNVMNTYTLTVCMTGWSQLCRQTSLQHWEKGQRSPSSLRPNCYQQQEVNVWSFCLVCKPSWCEEETWQTWERHDVVTCVTSKWACVWLPVSSAADQSLLLHVGHLYSFTRILRFPTHSELHTVVVVVNENRLCPSAATVAGEQVWQVINYHLTSAVSHDSVSVCFRRPGNFLVTWASITCVV